MVLPGRYTTNRSAARERNAEDDDGAAFARSSSSSTSQYDQDPDPTQNVHQHGSSAAVSASVTEVRRYWDQHSPQQQERRSHAHHQHRPPQSPYEHQQLEQHFEGQVSLQYHPRTRHHLDEYYNKINEGQQHLLEPLERRSAFEVDPHAHEQRRSITGKRKASDGMMAGVHDYNNDSTPVSSQYGGNNNVQITSHVLRVRSGGGGVHGASTNVNYEHGGDGVSSTQTRQMHHPYVHASDSGLHPGWLHRGEHQEQGEDGEEEETKAYQMPRDTMIYQRAVHSRSTSPSLESADTRSTYVRTSESAPSGAPVGMRNQASPPLLSQSAQSVPPGRMITNASRNITFPMLQPHFERPLQIAALHFGVCTTLLKKICRKNGIKNWPFRKICGLHKSIASMEKQVHYFDGEQKRSYADQLYKLQLELEAYKRTGNAPTPEFIASLEKEETEHPHQELLDDSETKTEEVNLAEYASGGGEGSDGGASVTASSSSSTSLATSSTLSAVSTRVSVSSYGYPASNQGQNRHSRRNQHPSHYMPAHRVMASTVELGDDDDGGGAVYPVYTAHRNPRTPQTAQQHHQQQFQRPPQQLIPHGRPLPTTSASTRSTYPTLRPLQRALPSLSFMLHRQIHSESSAPSDAAPNQQQPRPH